MSDLIFGGEVSGTPIETRGGTSAIGREILSGGSGRIQSGAARQAIGFGPTGVGIESAVQRLLADPSDRLMGLFAALEPFEQRQRNQAVATTRGTFGRLGGRFSENLLEGQSRALGEVSAQQQRTREEALLAAQGQQSQALAVILQGLLGARGQTLDFFAPGAPNFREGFLGDLIGAAGTIGGGLASNPNFFGFPTGGGGGAPTFGSPPFIPRTPVGPPVDDTRRPRGPGDPEFA